MFDSYESDQMSEEEPREIGFDYDQVEDLTRAEEAEDRQVAADELRKSRLEDGLHDELEPEDYLPRRDDGKTA